MTHYGEATGPSSDLLKAIDASSLADVGNALRELKSAPPGFFGLCLCQAAAVSKNDEVDVENCAAILKLLLGDARVLAELGGRSWNVSLPHPGSITVREEALLAAAVMADCDTCIQALLAHDGSKGFRGVELRRTLRMAAVQKRLNAVRALLRLKPDLLVEFEGFGFVSGSDAYREQELGSYMLHHS